MQVFTKYVLNERPLLNVDITRCIHWTMDLIFASKITSQKQMFCCRLIIATFGPLRWPLLNAKTMLLRILCVRKETLWRNQCLSGHKTDLRRIKGLERTNIDDKIQLKIIFWKIWKKRYSNYYTEENKKPMTLIIVAIHSNGSRT